MEGFTIDILSLKQKKLKILFITAGGSIKKKQIAFGHIFRSMNLANKFSKHKVFFLVQDYGGVKLVLEKNKIKNIKYLPKNIDVDKEIKIVIKKIQEDDINVIIIDKPYIKKKFFKEISKQTKIVYLSDIREIEFPVDLVISGFIGFQNKIVRNKYNSKCLIGPKYQIINEKFDVKKYNKKSIDLLVTFGGFDELGLTEFIFKRWLNMTKKFKMKIILGPGTKESKFIKKYKKKYSEILIIEKQTTKMYYEMQKTKFGLCAGGITSYEFTKMKVPFGIICMTKQQKLTAELWEKKGIAMNLGNYDSKLIKKIDNFLKLISTNKLTVKKSKFKSNNGMERIQQEIIKLVN